MEKNTRIKQPAVLLFQAALVSLLTALLLLYGMQTKAAEGGYTNYIPGLYGDFAMALEPAETWTLRNDSYYYNAEYDASRTVGEQAVEGRELGGGVVLSAFDLSFKINLTTLLYKPDVTLFGGQYAAGVSIPLVNVHLDAVLGLNDFELGLSDKDNGLGDIAFIPLFLFWNEGKYHWSFSQYVVAPTGEYDVDRPINVSLNYWSFDTNFALTYLDEEKGRDFSFNLGYIYNTENDETDYHTGQELHLDVALNQFLSESFAIGLQGFFLKQITGDHGDGAWLGDFKAESAGIGPAILWSRNFGKQNVTFIAKWIKEVHGRKRFEGDHMYLSFALDW